MQTEAATGPKFLTYQVCHPIPSLGVDCMLNSVQETFTSRLFQGLFHFSDWYFCFPGQTGTLHYILAGMALIFCLVHLRFHTSDKCTGLLGAPSLEPYASLK